MNISVVGLSSVVPLQFLDKGIRILQREGFDVKLHPQTKKKHLFFAGTHEDRAQAFLDLAYSDDVDIIWCARGGYGANHLLPYIADATQQRGVPEKPKLIVGYSDPTVLFPFLRSEWDWSTLHAPMVGSEEFSKIAPRFRRSLFALIHGERPSAHLAKHLQLLSSSANRSVTGRLLGGNLAVWTSLLGTPFQPNTDGAILFFEDIGESLSRIDKMVEQNFQAGVFDEIRAIVLGQFTDCNDRVPPVLEKRRTQVSQRKAFIEIFGKLGDRLGIPVWSGVASGHGGGHEPLPIGGVYELNSRGKLSLSSWNWLD